MKPWFLISIFSLSFSSSICRSDVPIKNSLSFDLKSTLAFAIENSPSFDSLKREVSISEFEKKSAFAKFFPSLDFATTYGVKKETPNTQDDSINSALNLDLTENLYDNGVTLTQYEISTIKRKQAEDIFKRQLNKLCLDIATEYLKFSLHVALLEIQESQFNLIKKQYELVSNDYHQGIKTRKDYLRFKTQKSRNEINLVNAKNLIANSSQELQKIIGIKLESGENITFIPIILADFVRAEKTPELNIDQHFDFQIAQMQKKINNLEADLIKRKYWPEISLSTGASYQTSQYTESSSAFSDNRKVEWNALITLKYNLWDWGIRARDSAIAVQKSVIQNNEQELKVLSLKSDINQLMQNLEKLRENFKMTKELLTLEQTNIDFIEREYRNGKVQYLDMITGLNDLADAQTQYYTALMELQTAQFAYKYHQGTLYDFIKK